MPMRSQLFVCLVPMLLVSGALVPVVAAAQGKSGIQSVDACTTPAKAKLEAAIGGRVMTQKVPASQPASAGVSICMWATPDGRRTLSVATYAPAALRNTQAGTIDTYYESLRTQTARVAGRPRAIPGVQRRAVVYPAARGSGDTILVLRSDCTVVINVAGFTPEQITAIAKAAGH